jgi:hypothetical protein
MKTLRTSTLRAAALATMLFVVPAIFSAPEPAAPDRAGQVLRATGRLAVQNVGPYVEIGTYRIQVSVKLGRASTVLPDGTWLYNNYAPENSAAKGTLVVLLINGRVSELYLATPAIVAALKDTSRPAAAKMLVASQDRR